jgi:hypothetical protein
MLANVFEVILTVVGKIKHYLPAAQLLQNATGGATGFRSHGLTRFCGGVEKQLMLKLILRRAVEVTIYAGGAFAQQPRHLLGVVEKFSPVLI